MPVLEFDPQAEQLKEIGIVLAKSYEPDFDMARDRLHRAEIIAIGWDDELKRDIFRGRIANDLGVVSVREGLYLRKHEKASNDTALEHVRAGIDGIQFSYESLLGVLKDKEPELDSRGWIPAVRSHIGATMYTWFSAVQTSQVLEGKISTKKRADEATAQAQWMLGRGTKEEPGAWFYVQNGDNGYWAVHTPFLGMRGERANGGGVHVLKAAKWLTRGVPELARRFGSDPGNRLEMVLTAGRLTLESARRRTAIAATLDHHRF